MRQALVLVLLALGAGGCATVDVYRVDPAAARLATDIGDGEARCARLFAAVDAIVDEAGVRDARAQRVPGFPYLRSDRLLAELARRAADGPGFDAWLRMAAREDGQARAIELANLPPAARARLPEIPVEKAMSECRLRLAGADLAAARSRERLRAAAQVPPDYRSWKRVLGLYPLTRIPFAYGVRRWQAQTEAVFNTPPEALPRRGRLVRYAPGHPRPSEAEVARLLAQPRRDPFGLPDWSDAERETLFRAFAPEFVVDEASHDDRVGALQYDADDALRVDFFRPVVYRRVSFARFAERWLPQFVYSLWFPARTPESVGDILAGRFDGLTWRVTVGPDGRPLAYDSMHNCGCYHLFIPTAAARARPQPESLDETLFAPQALPRLGAADRLALRLEAGTHYLQRVLVNDAAEHGVRPYAFADDDELRSLPLAAGGRRSAFGPDGIVPGSERGERFLFWPMGIANPGAMRQWGRHATAFVGMRHFDDPDLFEKYFESQTRAVP